MAKTVIHNFKVKSKEIKRYARKLDKKILRATLFAALEHVGQVSVSKYMKPTTPLQAVGEPSTSSKVTVRSGRLAGSIVGNWRFTKSNLPKSVERYVQGKVKSSGKGFEGGKRESIRQVSVSPGTFEGIIGSKVEYAGVQEKGGTIHPTVTSKSRALFWAMYGLTGLDKWKHMALTRQKQFNVHIKARPYLEPAVQESRPRVLEIFREAIQATFDRENI
jgi:phage gpG-like protein